MTIFFGRSKLQLISRNPGMPSTSSLLLFWDINPGMPSNSSSLLFWINNTVHIYIYIYRRVWKSFYFCFYRKCNWCRSRFRIENIWGPASTHILHDHRADTRSALKYKMIMDTKMFNQKLCKVQSKLFLEVQLLNGVSCGNGLIVNVSRTSLCSISSSNVTPFSCRSKHWFDVSKKWLSQMGIQLSRKDPQPLSSCKSPFLPGKLVWIALVSVLILKNTKVITCVFIYFQIFAKQVTGN